MKIYRVGGAVRDTLLGFTYNENDWVVVGSSPAELISLGYLPVGKDFPVFLHPNTKEEYALARTERKVGKGYKGFAFYSGPEVTLEDDLKRRDLTINAMAMSPEGQIIDPYGGQSDLKNKQLRHVSMAFTEDPLRVLRVARFSARYHHLGFTLAPETLALMKTMVHSGELGTLAAERLWKELERSLQEKTPSSFFSTLQDCDALAVLFPAFTHHFTARIEQLSRVASHTEDPLIRFGALFDKLNNDQVLNINQRLKSPNKFRQFAQLINKHGQDYRQCAINAKSKLTLLERLDAFRRPKRFHQFMTCCEGLYPKEEKNSELFRNALMVCKTIDAKPLAKTHKGQAVAKILHEERLKALRSDGV